MHYQIGHMKTCLHCWRMCLHNSGAFMHIRRSSLKWRRDSMHSLRFRYAFLHLDIVSIVSFFPLVSYLPTTSSLYHLPFPCTFAFVVCAWLTTFPLSFAPLSLHFTSTALDISHYFRFLPQLAFPSRLHNNVCIPFALHRVVSHRATDTI